MNYTVVGFFNEKDEAKNALQKLRNENYGDKEIDLSPFSTRGEYNNADYDYDEDENTSGFWDWLFSDDDDVRQRHSRVGARTHLVTVYAADKVQAEKAAAILDNCGALDVKDYDQKMLQNHKRDTSKNHDTHLNTNRTNLNANTNRDTIEVKKEEMNVGKRSVDTGGASIKSRIIEKPVKENIRLKEERVYVTRKPVNKKVTGDNAFEDKTIAMKEHAEKAVVEKNTRVVEEVALNKEVSKHEETIKDTVRETKVDIDKDVHDKDKRKA